MTSDVSNHSGTPFTFVMYPLYPMQQEQKYIFIIVFLFLVNSLIVFTFHIQMDIQ